MELSTEKFSYLRNANAEYIDEVLARYLKDPTSVDPTWRFFFEGMELGAEYSNGHANGVTPVGAGVTAATGLDLTTEAKAYALIEAYREFGRILANVNPLAPPPSSHPYLELGRFGLTDADLGKTLQSGNFLGMGPALLRDIIGRLRQIYCGNIAFEFLYMQNLEEREWVRAKVEAGVATTIDAETRKFILKRVTESETFERFLHTRYVAQKRFSIEGGESAIPALDSLIETGTELGAKEFVIGMAHRGRLNVLTNIMGKKPEFIFTEFEGTYDPYKIIGEGDVKYHMGFSADVKTRLGKSAHLSLGYNPSHLEFIDAVIEGVARAKQEFLGDHERTQVIPIQVHGDAALAGQGVCYETVQMSLLDGYKTGGTIHLVINNQVGFTTFPKDSRSSTYCTDLARMLDMPIFHVNGDDPEAMWNVCKLSMEYRQKFKKDVFIDMICYRKYGHNEGDEPSFTQPLLYKQIKEHPSPLDVYSRKLVGLNVVTEAQAQALVDELVTGFIAAQERTREEKPQPFVSSLEGRWKGLKRGFGEDLARAVDTTVPENTLRELAEKIGHVPAGFHLHPKLTRFFEARLKAVHEGKGIDWGGGEALAYASLVAEGSSVRLTGQDAERGTFTHRHSVLSDFETGETYTPLNHIAEGKQARFDVHNSHLSETAVMAFEYGYSLTDPLSLVIWEAQFGDFANGAQVIIDQFLSSGESKWQRSSGLVLLLPHGFEGQGPEHSSARLERFLQLAARDNIIVANLTTPAQLFHALRRQVKRDFRKPLIIMSPKSLLRHPHAISSLDEFSKRSFQEVLDDAAVSDSQSAGVKKVLLLSGKVYYDLLAEKTAKNSVDVAIVRVEQLYPFPAAQLATILKRYKGAQLAWVQEEPRNMGGWTYVFNQWLGGYARFADQVDGRALEYVGRESGAAPAVGSAKLHEKEQKSLVERAFAV